MTVPAGLSYGFPRAYLAGRHAVVRTLVPDSTSHRFTYWYAATEARRLQFQAPTQAAWWAGYADARRQVDSGRVLA